ncbi:AAA family ATPase [Arthrobacter globiformis]|uniref:AAA family ATPase n=1 Tax=Arthrobacter globiformis TaxID=1665 RepID=UPI002782795D|nr:SMC family ATPase [Arthrobacter globiformis]MDQ0865869.1 exonuclease SbcC [Arthrobacter globiformis]
MRIHRLEISAFGPFAGTEEIDFDRLSAHGLFLLNGPTGAGKTSVLDAICYALYGSVPGARQDGKRLRSDHADPAAEPRVTCEFTARGRRFEVSRTPAWDKPSARGRNGFTTQQAKTLLRERVAGAWVEKSGRNDEAGAEITALLGMDREQFTRVVLLPQGDFAAFLRSKASDRLELLQKLFGTERFEAVERELAVQAAGATREVADLEGRLDLLVERARAEATALEVDPDAAPESAGGPGLLSWLEAAALERAAALAGDAEACEAQRRGCTERLEAELAREGRRVKLAAALRRRADAEAAAPGLTSAGAALDLHRRAELLGGQLKAVTAAEALFARAEGAMDLASAGVREAASCSSELAGMERGAVVEHGSVDVAAELSRLRALAAVIGERLADEDRLGGLQARAAGLALRRQELIRAGDDHADRLLSLRTDLEALRAALQPLEQLAGESVLRTKEAAAADELVDVVRRYGIAAAGCAAVTDRHLKGREHHQELRRQWLDVREERLSNAAAELASRLEDGAPCPVCGSPEHPEPVPAGDTVLGLAEKEERAKERSEAAERALSALETELSEARQLVAVLASQGGDTDPAEAEEAARAAREAAAEAAAAVADLAASRSRQEELAERIDATEQVRVDMLSQLAQTESALTEIEGQSAALESSLEALRAGHASLGLRSDAVGQVVSILEQADAARSQLDQAAERLADARSELDRALPEAGFASAAEARQALLPGAEAARLESAVKAGRDEEIRLEELFASEELVVAAKEQAAMEHDSGSAVTAADLDLLRTEAEQAARAAKDVELAAGMARQSVTTLGRLRAEYQELAESGREPRERADVLKGLAEAARGSGDNSYRMSLNAYVLAARLEQVAIAASERLVAMSDGRYTLQHSDARAARNAKSGLGLEVVDEWTGRRRDTSTLSGGESFMASLSLALGLADVVQQEAGGVDIETLFVDEGFGSLDEQALEQVMDALEGLRDGGRVVGLVSHVGEMKQRIGSQLQVVKQRNGSTVHIVDALVTV